MPQRRFRSRMQSWMRMSISRYEAPGWRCVRREASRSRESPRAWESLWRASHCCQSYFRFPFLSQMREERTGCGVSSLPTRSTIPTPLSSVCWEMGSWCLTSGRRWSPRQSVASAFAPPGSGSGSEPSPCYHRRETRPWTSWAGGMEARWKRSAVPRSGGGNDLRSHRSRDAGSRRHDGACLAVGRGRRWGRSLS